MKPYTHKARLSHTPPDPLPYACQKTPAQHDGGGVSWPQL